MKNFFNITALILLTWCAGSFTAQLLGASMLLGYKLLLLASVIFLFAVSVQFIAHLHQRNKNKK